MQLVGSSGHQKRNKIIIVNDNIIDRGSRSLYLCKIQLCLLVSASLVLKFSVLIYIRTLSN